MTAPVQPRPLRPIAQVTGSHGPPSRREFGAVIASRSIQTDRAAAFAERGVFGVDGVNAGGDLDASVGAQSSAASTVSEPGVAPLATPAGHPSNPPMAAQDAPGQNTPGQEASAAGRPPALHATSAAVDGASRGVPAQRIAMTAAPTGDASKATGQAAPRLSIARPAPIRPLSLSIVGEGPNVEVVVRAPIFDPWVRSQLFLEANAAARSAGLDLTSFTLNGSKLTTGGLHGARPS